LPLSLQQGALPTERAGAAVWAAHLETATAPLGDNVVDGPRVRRPTQASPGPTADPCRPYPLQHSHGEHVFDAQNVTHDPLCKTNDRAMPTF